MPVSEQISREKYNQPQIQEGKHNLQQRKGEREKEKAYRTTEKMLATNRHNKNVKIITCLSVGECECECECEKISVKPYSFLYSKKNVKFVSKML